MTNLASCFVCVFLKLYNFKNLFRLKDTTFNVSTQPEDKVAKHALPLGHVGWYCRADGVLRPSRPEYCSRHGPHLDIYMTLPVLAANVGGNNRVSADCRGAAPFMRSWWGKLVQRRLRKVQRVTRGAAASNDLTADQSAALLPWPDQNGVPLLQQALLRAYRSFPNSHRSAGQQQR